MSEVSITQRVHTLLEALRAGDEAAGRELINLTYDRFRILARRILRAGFPRLRPWEETDDVVQEAALRLWKALATERPASEKEFFCLGAVQIRRQLTDLARRYFGRKSPDRDSPPVPARSPVHAVGDVADPRDNTWEPGSLAQWTEFHRLVDSLPDREREIVDLHFYQGLPQDQVAELLGVEKTTVKRRWRSAKRLLGRGL
jgi:RNA polymerase sigma-70 factor (ECF subfamily)